MNSNNGHKKKLTDPENLSREFFAGAVFPWEKSKDEVWRDLSVQLQEKGQETNEVRRFLPGRPWLAVAASVALLLAVSLFMRLYVREIKCLAGNHVSIDLPDGSQVELNALTTVRYRPYWWPFSREIHLEGEAYFEVEPGKRFTVESALASTEVLGTTFNIFARNLLYTVTCHSGRVRVISYRTKEEMTLVPNERANLDLSGSFEKAMLESKRQVPGWINNMIMFSSTPLRLVFDEIERQYGIIIVTPPDMDQLYSGNFSVNKPVDEVLYLLCRPFDLKYEQYTGKKYIVNPALME